MVHGRGQLMLTDQTTPDPMAAHSPELVALQAKIAEVGNDALNDDAIKAQYLQLTGEEVCGA